MGKLNTSVHVTDPETNAVVVYQRGDEVPDNHAELISNPNVWQGDDDEEEDAALPVPGASQSFYTPSEDVVQNEDGSESRRIDTGAGDPDYDAKASKSRRSRQR